MKPEFPGELVVERAGEVWVLTLRGEQDLQTAEALNAELEAVFQQGTKVVVDLSQATFIDSTTLSRLVRGRQLATSSWRHGFVVCAPAGRVARRVIRLVSLEDHIPVFETRDAALESLHGSAG